VKSVILALVVMLVTVACGDGGEVARPDDDARARQLARELIIVDTHIDVPYRLTEEDVDVGEATEGGDFDYPRAVEGGLNVPFMSIYVPASYQETGGARELADELIDRVEGIVAQHPDKFALAATVEEVLSEVDRGKMVLAMGMENGAPIEGDLTNVRHFHDRGIRYITLAHSKSNAISDSSYDEERQWGGLSPFGREVVAEMNRVGVMVDISHVTDDAARQAIALSTAPVIASHSSCRHFTPGWERNISDELIRLVADNGGVVQVNFGSGFVNEDYHVKWAEQWDAVDQYVEEHQIDGDSDEAKAFREQYRKEHPIEKADVSDVADHIDYIVNLVGIDHVGLGSDFDGLGDSLPHGLSDVSQYPNLIRELLERGYSDEQIGKICSDNILRVWSEVERVAQASASQGPSS
jgi:membrane dipeptidase